MKTFLEHCDESKTFYHGTTSHCLDGIKANGLIPHARIKASDVAREDDHGDRLNSVYITPFYQVAADYADTTAKKLRGQAVVLTVVVPFEFQANITQDEQDRDGLRFRGNIPVEWITFPSR